MTFEDETKKLPDHAFLGVKNEEKTMPVAPKKSPSHVFGGVLFGVLRFWRFIEVSLEYRVTTRQFLVDHVGRKSNGRNFPPASFDHLSIHTQQQPPPTAMTRKG